MSNVARLYLDAAPCTPGDARRLVRHRMSVWGSTGDVTDDVILMTSELVSNVILHSDSAVDVVLRRLHDNIRVEVYDDDPHMPRRVEAAPDAVSGRGLAVLDALARDWGTFAVPDGGKCVWFEVRA